MTNTILITGGTGAVGPRVVEALVAAGYAVRVLALDPPKPGMFPDGVEFRAGSITDPAAVRDAVQGCSGVIHLAALLHIMNPPPELRPKYEAINIGGTRCVVEAAQAAGVERVVLFSTIAVYGYGAQDKNKELLSCSVAKLLSSQPTTQQPSNPATPAELPSCSVAKLLSSNSTTSEKLLSCSVAKLSGSNSTTQQPSNLTTISASNSTTIPALHMLTETTPCQPDTFYGETKLAAEKIVLDARRADGAPLGTVLRMSAIYGSGIKGNYRKLALALARGRFIPIGPGNNCRTLVYDRDAAAAAALALAHPAAAGQIYNVTDGRYPRLCEIIAAISRALGRRPPRLRIPVWAAKFAAAGAEFVLRLFLKKPPALRATVGKYLEDVAVSGEKLQRELGFVPKYELTEGWRECVAEMRKAGEL